MSFKKLAILNVLKNAIFIKKAMQLSEHDQLDTEVKINIKRNSDLVMLEVGVSV